MRVYVTSTPDELEPLRRLAADAIRESGSVPIFREPHGLDGFKAVAACTRQVARADSVLAIVGHRHDDVPPPADGGDGRHPWVWWETRAAFERDIPVTALLAEDPNANADDLLRDLRGELARLGTSFDRDDPQTFRDLVRGEYTSGTTSTVPASTAPTSTATITLRQWPPPKLPSRPYPVLLPYTHPDLLAGRDREIDTLRRRLERSVAITGLHALSGVGKSSLLAGGLVPLLRAEGRPVAFERQPTEPGLPARLLTALVNNAALGNDAAVFIDHIKAVRQTANAPPVLILDQFEDLFRDLPGAENARREIGELLATSVQRLPGWNEPPCRWLLAYRQEFHSDVVRWLRDIREREASPASSLPTDLSTPDRFQTFVLQPLGTPTPGATDPLSSATKAFEDAITKPLTLKNDDNTKRYPWHFMDNSTDNSTDNSAARLAAAFGEARAQRPDAPLAPELQVVLAHLLDNADPGTNAIHVPEDPAGLIDQALEEHLRRSLDVAFPGTEKEKRLGRTRALLALRELADAQGRRGSGRSVLELAHAIGPGGNKILEKLATSRTRIVLLEENDGEYVYVLSHDRMAEVLVRLFDEGTFSGLGVDTELLGLRRVVALHCELYASGEVEQSTVVASRLFNAIDHHAEALLWSDNGRLWWRACRERRERDRRVTRDRYRMVTRTVIMLLALLAFAALLLSLIDTFEVL